MREDYKNALWIFGVAVLFSFLPLALATSALENPFWFNAGLNLSCAVGFFLLTRRDTAKWRAARGRFFARLKEGKVLFWGSIGYFSDALLAWSFLYLDISVAVMLFYVFPIFWILRARILKHTDGTDRRSIWSGSITMLFILLGIGLATWAQIGDKIYAFLDWPEKSTFLNALFGFFLLATAIRVIFWLDKPTQWGKFFRDDHSAQQIAKEKDVFYIYVGVFAGRGIAFLLNFFAGFVFGFVFETLELKILAWGLLCGFFLNFPGELLWRKADAAKADANLYAISCLTPIVALVLVYFFQHYFFQQDAPLINFPHQDWLIIGVLAIIIAVFLLSFAAEVRFGYKALFFALWICGAWIYWRGDNFTWHGGEYFNLLALSATLFTFILSFRMVRFVRRTTDEENLAMSIFRRLEFSQTCGEIDQQAHFCFLQMCAPKNPEEQEKSYNALKKCVVNAKKRAHEVGGGEKMAEIEADIDAFAHSRQQGFNFGELIALFIFAAITVSIVLFARPDAAGWNGFLADMFAMLFAAVIVFLLVNVWDLNDDRNRGILRQTDGVFGVDFRDTRSRRVERWLSVGVCTGIAAAYGYLLWGKWLG